MDSFRLIPVIQNGRINIFISLCSSKFTRWDFQFEERCFVVKLRDELKSQKKGISSSRNGCVLILDQKLLRCEFFSQYSLLWILLKGHIPKANVRCRKVYELN